MPNNLPEAYRSVLYVLQMSQSTHPYHALLLSYHVSGAQQMFCYTSYTRLVVLLCQKKNKIKQNKIKQNKTKQNKTKPVERITFNVLAKSFSKRTDWALWTISIIQSSLFYRMTGTLSLLDLKLAFDLLDVNESKFEGIEICI